ncbi:uncharacterized protein LOC122502813 [Leptopilina heterotoma]|uniref:uncharacterized protein LOC122502813 n=1 Tax=Leptopilina heterotoma TaxID=63436 RepID=UPI001CA9A91A|nr:uncharacterized protein LOC122502813 [Leptopilina heterotoma]
MPFSFKIVFSKNSKSVVFFFLKIHEGANKISTNQLKLKMMSNTVTVNHQFLSVCYYITSFGLLLNNNDLLVLGMEQDAPRTELFNVPTKFLNRSKRSDEASDDGSSPSKKIKYTTIKKESTFEDDLLKNLRKYTWNELTKNVQTTKNLRLVLNKLAYYQTNEKWLEKPMDLWHMDSTQNILVFQYLRNLKGHSFSFNDITVMTNQDTTLTPHKLNQNPFRIMIHYHCLIDSQYGFLDLTTFDRKNINNKYITFPDVKFTVTNTELSKRDNGGINLHIELKQQLITKELWKITRHQEFRSLFQQSSANNIKQVLRMQRIEETTRIITQTVPLCSLKTATDLLKSYILKIESSDSHVPTFQKFGEDYCNLLKIDDSYQKFLITNRKYIDDILYESSLNEITNLDDAVRKINKLYDTSNEKYTQLIFKKYTEMPTLIHFLRFEDFYLINTRMTDLNVNPSDEDLTKIETTISRIAIRQALLKPIKKPLTLYCGDMVDTARYNYYKNLTGREIVQFNRFYKFSTDEKSEKKKLSPNPELNSVLFVVQLIHPAGMADIGRYFIHAQKLNYAPYFSMSFVVDKVKFKKVKHHEVLVVKMHDLRIPKEEKIVQMIKRMNTIFATRELYID